MPGYKGHIVGGLAAYGVTLYFLQSHVKFSPVVAVIWFVAALAGALFPDVDIKSKGRNIFYSFYSVAFVLVLFLRVYRLIIPVAVVGVMPLCVKHRGLFHRSWFVIGISCVLAWLAGIQMPASSQFFMLDALFFSVGALSHIWLDLGVRGLFRL